MIALWMVYAGVVSLALCVAAASAERGLRLGNWPLRGAWVGATAGAVVLPLAGYLVGPISPLRSIITGGDATEIGAGGAAGTSLPEVFGATRGVAEGLGGGSGDLAGAVAALSDAAAVLDEPLLTLWLALSAVLGGRLVVGWWRVRRPEGGRRERIQGRSVLVTEADGPALAGALRPEIVVPEWFLELPSELRELALRHEEAHRRAGDPWLVLAAEMIRVFLPWNPGIHWAVRRLRRAVELDCDRRLLEAGTDRGRYGRLLVVVGQRSIRSGVTGAVALTERTSNLKRRLTMMRPNTESWTSLRVGCAALVALTAVALACETPVPPVEEKPSQSGEVSARQTSQSSGGVRAIGDTLRPGAPGAPVVLIDGAVAREPVDVGALDIELIEVIEGKAAAELFGSRAPNGVVRITTVGGDTRAETGIQLREARRIDADSFHFEDSTGKAGGRAVAGGVEAPLVVVDGVIQARGVNLEELDHLEIERVEVVKGEAARALYGERARDGLIRISTKKGG